MSIIALRYFTLLRGNDGLMTWLLDLCADPRICAESATRGDGDAVVADDYESPIMAAARWGHLNVVNMLLDLHPSKARKSAAAALRRSRSENSLDSIERDGPRNASPGM